MKDAMKKAIPHGVAFFKKLSCCFLMEWAKMDSNHRRYKPADLQSAPFGHSGIRPCRKSLSRFDNAKLRKKFGLCQIKIEFFYKKGGRILDIGFFLLIYQIFMVVFMLGAEIGGLMAPAAAT